MLLADGKTIGGVSYRVSCFASEFQKRAEGTLTGDSVGPHLTMVHGNAKLQLRLEDGGLVEIVPRKTTGGGEMLFAVSGPVPGC